MTSLWPGRHARRIDHLALSHRREAAWGGMGVPSLATTWIEEGAGEVMPERWQEVKKVLAGALERTPEQRGAYLDQSCTDATLRREVESLIAAHEQGDSSFMERPVAGNNEGLKPGSKLGPYEIL